MTLQLENITFGFNKNKPILKDISFTLDEKKIYALMGSNGAGKTTLFNIITGFIKSQSGTVSFYKKNITNQQPFKISRRGISRTFQDVRITTKLNVIENVILAMRHNPTDKWPKALLPEYFYLSSNRALAKKANEIVEQFFLTDIKNSLAGEISYGQQKLLSLACCVASGATLLLLDEVVAGIQPEYRAKIGLLISQMKEQGKTILIIEHDSDFLAKVADKIYFLHEGRNLEFESIEELRENSNKEKLYY